MRCTSLIHKSDGRPLNNTGIELKSIVLLPYRHAIHFKISTAAYCCFSYWIVVVLWFLIVITWILLDHVIERIFTTGIIPRTFLSATNSLKILICIELTLVCCIVFHRHITIAINYGVFYQSMSRTSVSTNLYVYTVVCRVNKLVDTQSRRPYDDLRSNSSMSIILVFVNSNITVFFNASWKYKDYY